MRVLVTGMIAGMDDDSWMDQLLAKADHAGVPLKTYNFIRQLEATGEKRLNRLLGATNYLFQVLREREYRKIGFDMIDQGVENAVIRAPATIEWNRINIKLKDHREIAEYIRPDVIVTLIDAEWMIRQRFQQADISNAFLRSIKQQNHTFHEILSWMNEEVSLSEDWARHMGVPHYVIPVSQAPGNIMKLVRRKNIPSFYVSYSMTHSDAQARKEVNAVIKRLDQYGVVIDPQAIEIGQDFDSDTDKRATYSYTVHRDLHWFVGKVDAVVAIHPYVERPPLSTGMMDELGHARDYLKRRYMIFPPKNLSPFTTDSYIEQGHVFSTGEEFFLCLEAEGFKPLES
ncbi:MAG: hypothetical protein RRC34_11290 [Lentisphaeria bacterium]|nr:hypothetical protein [Lentisphaeria bacterium]